MPAFRVPFRGLPGQWGPDRRPCGPRRRARALHSAGTRYCGPARPVPCQVTEISCTVGFRGSAASNKRHFALVMTQRVAPHPAEVRFKPVTSSRNPTHSGDHPHYDQVKPGRGRGGRSPKEQLG
eukprot:750245-Hanusia_phi.AAC.3